MDEKRRMRGEWQHASMRKDNERIDDENKEHIITKDRIGITEMGIMT